MVGKTLTQAVGDAMTASTYELFVWYRHVDPAENTKRLTAALAPKISDEVINEVGTLCRLRNGAPVPIGKEDMHDIVSKHIRTPVVVNRDTGKG
jgi:hypothetical protein